MPFLLKGEGAVFLVSLMIGYLNADVSVKTKSDDYSSKHCFPPCHLLPSPSSSGLAFCQHLQVGDLACCIFWTLSPFPLPHCKKNTQLKVIAQFCINPLKRAQLDAAGGLTSIRLSARTRAFGIQASIKLLLPSISPHGVASLLNWAFNPESDVSSTPPLA